MFGSDNITALVRDCAAAQVTQNRAAIGNVEFEKTCDTGDDSISIPLRDIFLIPNS